jgi:hypothetical protein
MRCWSDRQSRIEAEQRSGVPEIGTWSAIIEYVSSKGGSYSLAIVDSGRLDRRNSYSRKTGCRRLINDNRHKRMYKG